MYDKFFHQKTETLKRFLRLFHVEITVLERNIKKTFEHS